MHQRRPRSALSPQWFESAASKPGARSRVVRLTSKRGQPAVGNGLDHELVGRASVGGGWPSFEKVCPRARIACAAKAAGHQKRWVTLLAEPERWMALLVGNDIDVPRGTSPPPQPVEWVAPGSRQTSLAPPARHAAQARTRQKWLAPRGSPGRSGWHPDGSPRIQRNHPDPHGCAGRSGWHLESSTSNAARRTQRCSTWNINRDI